MRIELEYFKVLYKRSSQRGGQTAQFVHVPPSPHNMGLATWEHTDGRVHFTGRVETVSDVPGHTWDPLARNSDLRSDRETAKPMVRHQNFVKISCTVL